MCDNRQTDILTYLKQGQVQELKAKFATSLMSYTLQLL